MKILHFLSSKSAAYKIERLQIESSLWWGAYGRLKIQFVELDFSNLIFQKWSAAGNTTLIKKCRWVFHLLTRHCLKKVLCGFYFQEFLRGLQFFSQLCRAIHKWCHQFFLISLPFPSRHYFFLRLGIAYFCRKFVPPHVIWGHH